MIKAGRKAVISADPNKPSQENMGELVHVMGKIIYDPVKDEEFGIRYPDALILIRYVEVYQWVEKSYKEEDIHGIKRDAYRYEKEWSSKIVDQRSFHNQEDCHPRNPDSWPCQNESFTAYPVNLGSFQLTREQVRKINNFKDVPLSSRIDQGTVLETI